MSKTFDDPVYTNGWSEGLSMEITASDAVGIEGDGYVNPWYGKAASGLPVTGMMISIKKLKLWGVLQWHNLNSFVRINQPVQKLKSEDTQINTRAKWWSQEHTISLSIKNPVPTARSTFHPLYIDRSVQLFRDITPPHAASNI